jgi:hypothetical protein
MSPVTITLDVAQILALAGVVWGLSRMSSNLDNLVKSHDKLVETVERIGNTVVDLLTRVGVLEAASAGDRPRRRS